MSVETLNPLNAAFVRFRGLLRTDRLAPEYLALDGVLAAEQNFLLPLPHIQLDSICAFVEGTRYHYLFETPGLEAIYWYFITERPGTEPILVEAFKPLPITFPPPSWLHLFESCRQASLQF